jgi:ubiquinone/menaquinone biosynthesis C-methylase UbiE
MAHSTSWEPVQKWYSKAVGEEGLYYHQRIILPGTLRLMGLQQTSSPSVLDIACGQGILARHLPPKIPYVGIDLSPSLIATAKRLDKNPHHHYHVGDVTQRLPKLTLHATESKSFTHAALILALQNIEHPKALFQHLYTALEPTGKCVVVINHPCFRIPRQSSWQIEPRQRIRYRRVDKYMSSLKIPIRAHPGQGNASQETLTFHHSLSTYSLWLQQTGFVIDSLEEWCSDKWSEGGAAKMENSSRREFPLFLAFVLKKTVEKKT